MPRRPRSAGPPGPASGAWPRSENRRRGASVSDQDLPSLEAEARHARERFQLYSAGTLGPKPTDATRLRELERSCQRAAIRLRRARTVPEHN